MDKKYIKQVLNNIFQICYLHISKYFINNLNTINDEEYDKDILIKIKELEDIINKKNELNEYNNKVKYIHKNDKVINHIHKNDKIINHTHTNDKVINHIKKNVTTSLKEKYGNDISIDFQYENSESSKNNYNDNENNSNENNYDDNENNYDDSENNYNENNYNENNDNEIIYSIRVKYLTKRNPNPEDFNLSEIYINTDNKTLNIKKENNFLSFPLNKKSIIKLKRK